MKPSVGRIVHYVARGSADGMYPAVCRAAIIAEVKATNTLASIVVLNPTGLFFHENCVHDEDDKYGGTWHWPERVE